MITIAKADVKGTSRWDGFVAHELHQPASWLSPLTSMRSTRSSQSVTVVNYTLRTASTREGFAIHPLQWIFKAKRRTSRKPKKMMRATHRTLPTSL